MRLAAIACLIGVCLSLQTNQVQTSVPALEGSYLIKINALPRYRVPGGVEIEVKAIAYIGEQSSNIRYFENQPIWRCRAIELPWRNISQASLSQHIFARVKINPLKKTETSPYRQSLRLKGYSATCDITHASMPLDSPSYTSLVRNFLANLVRTEIGDSESAGLFLGMTLGVRDGITDQLEEAFRKTSLAHLLVLSGYQITLVALTLQHILRKLLIFYSTSGRFLIVVDCIALSPAYLLTLISGCETAALRAAIALSLTTISTHHEHATNFLGLTSCTFLITLLLTPNAPYDLSSLLTFGALFGICLGAACPGKFRIVNSMNVLLYCSITTTLLSTIYFKTFCIGALFFNAVFATALSFISCNLGLLAILLLSIRSIFGGLLLRLTTLVLDGSATIISTLAESPLAAWQLTQKTTILISLCLFIPLILRTSRCLEHYLLSHALYPLAAK